MTVILSIKNVQAVFKDDLGNLTPGMNIDMSYIPEGAPAGTPPTDLGTQTTDSTGTAKWPDFTIVVANEGEIFDLSAKSIATTKFASVASNVVKLAALVSGTLQISVIVSQTLS